MVSALERLAYFSGIDRHWTGWQHASIARRVEFLSRAASDPLFERRLHRRVRLLGGLILAVNLSPLVAYLLRWGGTRPPWRPPAHQDLAQLVGRLSLTRAGPTLLVDLPSVFPLRALRAEKSPRIGKISQSPQTFFFI